MPSPKPTSIDNYIEGFPPEVRKALELVRRTVKEVAPEAEETISYAIPTFKLNGYLAYFAGFKKHIGFYPAPVGVKAFQKDLAGYKTGRGSVQFPLDRPMPVELIRRMVKWRLKELQTKPKKTTAAKAKAKE